MKKVLFNKNSLGVLVIFLMVVLVAACGGSQDTGSQSSDTSDNGSSSSNADSSGNDSQTSDSGSSGPVQLSLGMPPSGSSYNSVGSGVASVISKNSNIRVTAKPYDGLSSWAPLMNSGEIQLGVGSAPEAFWTYNGDHGHQKNSNMRMLVVGHYLAVNGLLTRLDSDINSVADVKGKRLASDFPGSLMASETTLATLELNGLTWDDVQPVPVPSTVAGTEAIRDGRADVAFAISPPTATAKEVHNAIGIKPINFLDEYTPEQMEEIPQSIEDELNTYVPGTQLTVLEPNGYITEPVLGFKYAGIMMAADSLSEEIVYQLMEILWEHYEELHPIHGWLSQWSPEIFFDPNPVIPYHEGAIQFFKDQGLWNDEVETIQQSFFN